MITRIPSGEHYVAKHDWLTTYHHFSFGEYYNQDKMGFGPLRVFNDDTISPAKGFGFHPHSDMEIITYLIEGELEHKDNFGNHGIIMPGEVQRMSAGTGIIHSEFNHSEKNPLRLLQMWVIPNKKGLRPSWEQHRFSKDMQRNILLPVVTPEGSQGSDSLKIHQDATFYLSTLSSGKTVQHKMPKNRIAYFFLINGNASLNGIEMKKQDAATIQNEEDITVEASAPSDLILVDLPQVSR